MMTCCGLRLYYPGVESQTGWRLMLQHHLWPWVVESGSHWLLFLVLRHDRPQPCSGSYHALTHLLGFRHALTNRSAQTLVVAGFEEICRQNLLDSSIYSWWTERHHQLRVSETGSRKLFSSAVQFRLPSSPQGAQENGDAGGPRLLNHHLDLLGARHHLGSDCWIDCIHTRSQQHLKKALVVGPCPCSVEPNDFDDETRVEWVHPSEHQAFVAAEAVVEIEIGLYHLSMPVPGFLGSSPLVIVAVEVSCPY